MKHTVLLPLLALPLLGSCESLMKPATPTGAPPAGVYDPTPEDIYDRGDAVIAGAKGANDASAPFNPLAAGVGGALAAAAAAWGAYKAYQRGLYTPTPNTPSGTGPGEVKTPSN